MTGERSDSPSAGSPPDVAEAAARTASKPLVRSAAVLGSSAATRNTSPPRWTYHPSAVRMTSMLRGCLA